MPRLDPQAVRRLMTRRNLLFKHQLANSIGFSYEQLTQAIVDGDEVEELLVTRLCDVLACERTEIVKEEEIP